jgi:hypothetical protein
MLVLDLETRFALFVIREIRSAILRQRLAALLLTAETMAKFRPDPNLARNKKTHVQLQRFLRIIKNLLTLNSLLYTK